MGDPYAEHGARTDEAIAIMRALWTQAMPSHHGRVYQFSGMAFSPNPLQKPHFPGIGSWPTTFLPGFGS